MGKNPYSQRGKNLTEEQKEARAERLKNIIKNRKNKEITENE